MTEDFYCDEVLSAREVAKEVLAEHGACRVLTNLGEYQDSKHLHWHVSAGEPQKGTRKNTNRGERYN